MLRQLILNNKITKLRSELSALVNANDALAVKRSELNKREEELASALREVTPEISADDQKVLEDQVDALENDVKTQNDAESANDAERASIEAQIASLQAELDSMNERADVARAIPENDNIERTNDKMETREFFGRSAEMLTRDDVKGFITRVREARMQNRSVTNADLLIPDVLLPILREVAAEESKLLKHVNVKAVAGTSRQNVLGAVPQAVWTEATGKINTISFGAYQVELDGYKVAGMIAVPNATLEDASDLDLATECLTMIGRAIGKALDMAILYGTGTKMPLGIVTRLAQTAQPSGYPSKARAWADLHTSNVITIASTKTDAALFKAIVEATGAVHNSYASGGLFWACNQKTFTKLQSAALSINAAGAIVSGATMTMPVVGGAIELLDFIPDDNIIFGYGEEYVLAERKGTQLAVSTDVYFAEDQTAFRGTARYDGTPVIAEGFAIIGIGGTAPTTSSAVTFATDSANAE